MSPQEKPKRHPTPPRSDAAPPPPPPAPSRRRLTEAEWEAELQRAKDVQAADHERFVVGPKPLRSRTGRRRSWWRRGWKR